MSTWQPTATLHNLHLRAAILQKIRSFFAERNVLEVETPLLSHATATDLHLHSFKTEYYPAANTPSQTLYLQTSPEFAMKRLLAAGSGSIFQICKAFRNEGESGRLHNPEFTLLEWYRVGFDHHTLMDEMDTLLQSILNRAPAKRITYAELFQNYAGIDPHTTANNEIKTRALELGLTEIAGIQNDDRDTWLQLLMTHFIEPQLPINQATFIYDFPATQAALARIRPGNPSVAERFEVYVGSIELANGFHELTDVQEQRQRFLNDNKQRKESGCPEAPIDQHLLAALNAGLPNCAGVALGIDRLILLAAQAQALAEVISFSVANA